MIPPSHLSPVVGLAIAADASGLAYVTGQTASDTSLTPFPTTYNALQSSLASVSGNAFFSVLDTTNGGPYSLIYSTYLGGGSTGFGDYGLGIAVDGSGDAFLTGQTTSGGSTPFPTTSGAYQTTLNSQYGNVFVSEIATAQSGCQCLVYSSYLGGSSTIIVGDEGSGIGLDSAGKIYVGGDTTSADFPVTSGAYQTTNSPAGKGFVAAFDPTQTGSQSLVYSTLLGGTNGSEGEVINALTVDKNGDAFVAGSTSSSDFPTTSGALQTVLKNPSWDAFLSELNPSGTSLLYSTYFGGSCANGDLGNGVALDWLGNPYLSGSTCSSDLSVYPANAYQATLGGTYNTFVAKIASNSNPGIMATASPAPNSSSWNNSPVTVSFLCIPGVAPVQSCTSAVTVTTEGANQIVSGTAIDTSNNSATASDTVNLDMTPPVMNITSPANGATVNSASLTVTGTITDALSGVSAVTCNGQQATIIGSTFSCAISISSAIDTIAVTAADVAGNAAATTISVNLSIPGGFASTNNLNVARQGHTATLLTNGMVLITGGEDVNSVDQATAEIYNPATASFTSTGTMTVARMNHTATLLNDGTVLITGGYDSNFVPLSSAEIYNPATGTFSAIAGMSTGRALHTATLLEDGTVLIAGGYDSNSNALSSAELYSPGAGTFSGVGSLLTGRVSHTGTLLNNGQVLIVGGQDTYYNVLDSAELYNPTSQIFTATGNLNIGRYLHSATLLNNGTVLVAAGEDPTYNIEASAELFDPNAGTFSFTGSLGTARDSHTATLLSNGSVLIAGGFGGSETVGSTELFDPVAQTFSPSGSLNTARSNQTATLLTDGTVLLAGGFEFTGGFDPTLASSEIYQPTSLALPNLVSIALTPSAASVGAGTAQRFTATGTFSDNSTEVLSSAIWSSSNNTAATTTNDWSNQGAAFGVAPGSATISACTGTICGLTPLTVTTAQLSITSLSPVAGDVGTQVIISGTEFGATQGNSTVTFNGTPAVVSLWGGTAVVVTVPVGATSGNIVVTVGSTSSNGVAFAVTSGPVITGISPTEGFVGAPVAISGINFGGAQGSSTVTFNGLAASVSSWSNSSIGVNVPTGATTGNLIVTAEGLASNAVPFTVPNIAQIVPSSGPVGTLITIEGSGFGSTQGSGTASINGTPLQVIRWSDTQVMAAVANGTSSGPLTVQNAVISISGPTFTVNSAPAYTISPQTLNLFVGQTQRVSAPVGLQWLTTNPGVVSLSTDDPPILTAVAVGSATVYAGVVPISVTVYGGALPPGTISWSAPSVPGLTTESLVQAVPTANGPDFYTLDTGTPPAQSVVRGFRSDGELLWQQSIAGAFGSLAGDGFGGVLLSTESNGAFNLVDLSGQTGQTNWQYSPRVALSACLPSGRTGRFMLSRATMMDRKTTMRSIRLTGPLEWSRHKYHFPPARFRIP